jgi:hypothetical protein
MKHTPKHSKTRVVGYDFGFNPRRELNFNETAAEKILKRALKKGIVTQYDTGRGHCLWFEGPPGPELREVRRQVKELIDGH